MERRKFTKEFKFEAVKLVTDRGVAVAQASRDLDIAESVLRRWIREAMAAPVAAFPGNGLQRAEMAEIAALKKEVAKLKAERDILKKPRHSLRGFEADSAIGSSNLPNGHEVRLHSEAPPYLAGQLDVRGFGGFPLRLSRVAEPPSQR